MKVVLIPAIRRLAMVALFVAFVTPAFAWDEPDGFRGVPWGASREELQVHLQRAGDTVTCSGTGMVGCTSRGLKIGPAVVNAAYFFAPDADKFEVVYLSFGPTHYKALRAIFEERYGTPSKFTNDTALWVGERVNISLNRHGSKLDQGNALIGLKTAFDRQREESQKAIKKGKDDL
jgi:hypothetical protein